MSFLLDSTGTCANCKAGQMKKWATKSTGFKFSPHDISFKSNCFHTIYICKSRKSPEHCRTVAHPTTKTLLSRKQTPSAQKGAPDRPDCAAVQSQTTRSSCSSKSHIGQDGTQALATRAGSRGKQAVSSPEKRGGKFSLSLSLSFFPSLSLGRTD